MSAVANSAVARQYARLQEADAQAHALWEKVDREQRKLIRMAKIGRKGKAVVPISETRGIEIRNQFRGEDKVFAPAFARKWKIKEVPLES
jgi:hypothetical protein